MARRIALIAALLGAVLLGHGLVLQWLAWQAQERSALRQMAAPMFTRLLQPKAPELAVATPPPAKRRQPSPPSVRRSVSASTPPLGTATVAPAEPQSVASEPSAGTSTAAITPALDVPSATASETGTAPKEETASTAPSAAQLDSWPADTRLSYRLGGFYRGELHGSARVQWQRESEHYQTRIDIDLGLVSQAMTSQGVVTEHGLAPNAYEETRVGQRRFATLQDKTVTLSDGRQLPRPAGVPDTASQFGELSHRFASGQLLLEVGRSVSFWMVRPGGLDHWTYDIVEKEVLQTPQLGAVEAFHLKPRPIANPRGSIVAEMWFAPSLQYLPVRIRVTTGDAWVDLVVEKIEQR
ncbi:MAG: hypothetical protein NVS3B2_07880 [Ramlibacter sp.]